MTNTNANIITTTQRQAAWSRIGKDVSIATTIDEVLEQAKLDYTVHSEPIYIGNGIEIPNKVANVDNYGRIKGVVGPDYTICQNRDAFEFVNEISDKITFEKAGETHWGMVYVIAKLDDVNVLGDKMAPYVILQNGHNGSSTLKATICPLRIVCQNQFAMSFKKSPNTIRILHTSKIHDRMYEAAKLMKNVAHYMEEFVLSAEELATLKIDYDKANLIIQKFFEKALTKQATERQINSIAKKVDELQTIYTNTVNTDLANFKGTGWGLVNAFSDYITHKKPARITEHSDESIFYTATFDTRLIQEFINFMRASVI